MDTAVLGTQAVDSLGRWARRTSIQLPCSAMIGRTDG